jgi:ribose transport system permease protein
LIGLSVGIVAGMLNGLIITQVGITDFIVTLASMSIAHGFIFAYSGGKTIYQNIPKSFLFIGQGRVVDIPVPVILVLIVFVLGHLLLSRFRIGVHVYATGGNREAARLSGIKVDKVRIFSYTVSGLTAATAGIIMASRLGSGQPTAGDTFLFDAIGAVVLGGTSLMGGTGTVVGTLAGVGIIGVISNGLTQLNVSFYYQEVIKGLIILLAVSYNSYRDKQ